MDKEILSSISTALNRLANAAEAQQADARDVLEIKNPELRLKREARELAYHKAIEEDNAKYWAEVDARDAKDVEDRRAKEALDRAAREQLYLEEKAQIRKDKFYNVLMLFLITASFTYVWLAQ